MAKKKKKSKKNRTNSVPIVILAVIVLLGILIVPNSLTRNILYPEINNRTKKIFDSISTRVTSQAVEDFTEEKGDHDEPVITQYDNLAIGVPVRNGIIINRPGYAICYVEETEQPSWVQYRLTKNEVQNKVTKRKDDFRPDPMIKTGSATLNDYRRSGYDRGHLAPAGDMAWSKEAMSQSFFMSNMSPQKPGFNRGIWKNLESLIRKWAVKEQGIYVVTGPLFRRGFKTIGANKVAVPQFYYKIVLDNTPPGIKAIGFIFPNAKTNKPLRSFVVSVDRIEEITGYDFFSKLPDDVEGTVEKNSDWGSWSR